MRCWNSHRSILVSAVILLFLWSCKKDVPKNPEKTEPERSQEQLVKDSVYFFYKLYSLWSDGDIPTTEEAISFSDKFDSPLSLLNSLKNTTPFHLGYQSSIDRFSYVEDIRNVDQAAFRMDADRGFGLFLSIGAVSEDRAYPVVYFVEGGSPADQKEIKRSDVILEIDGYGDMGMEVECGSTSCQVVDPNLYQKLIDNLLAAMEQNQMQLTLLHADGSESTVDLSSSYYEVDPIIKHSVFSYPAKNIGYLALSSFEDVSEGTVNRQEFENVFEEFEQNQINDLVVDLRYNTGGFVNAAEYVANKVINGTSDKSLMYSYVLNEYLFAHSNRVEASFEDVYFHRNNSLDLKTVYFLVTDITASASELLINVLKPYMNVVVIAENQSTYGKPVGFFKQDIMNHTSLWVASFKLVNAAGVTDYWDGIAADKTNVTDYIFRDFGDVEEPMLAAAITDAVGALANGGMNARVFQVEQPRKRALGVVNAIKNREML